MNTELKAWEYIYSINCEQDTDPNRIAITDGIVNYTYDQMFEMWKKYAAVFSYLGMTGVNNSRVGMLGATTPEVIVSFYSLNMVGAEISMLSSFNALNSDKIIHDIREENLTDLIITDEMITEKNLRKLIVQKQELGLRNIIMLHTRMGGSTVPVPVGASCEAKAYALRQKFPMLYMDTLMRYYGNTPISFFHKRTENSLILHTSGTTSGSGKPVVLSDTSFNTVAEGVHSLNRYDDIRKNIVSLVIVDLSNVFGIVVQVHAMLSLGATVVTTPGNSINPLMYRAIREHGVTVAFFNGAVADLWMKNSDTVNMDFSSLKMVILGGSYISKEDKIRYYQFFENHGATDLVMLNGYGISEVGGVCSLTGPDIEDESIGYPFPGCELRFLDEDTDKYMTVMDAPCEGVMYIHSPSMTSGILDGREIIKQYEIDGLPYICTNDLIRVDKTGKLIYLGRANRYFLNENGEKYQSGRVETEFAKQYGIGSCGIVPVYEKVGHDNLPMMCVTTTDECTDPIETVRNALLDIFKNRKTLSAFHVPRFILLAEELPRNANGKIDLYKINKGEVIGQKYSVNVVMKNTEISDISLKLLEEDACNMIEEVYKGIAKDLVSDAVKKPDISMRTAMIKMQSYLIKNQMYMNLMMQQNMLVMNWIGNRLFQTSNIIREVYNNININRESNFSDDNSERN